MFEIVHVHQQRQFFFHSKWDQLDEVDISMSRPSFLWKSSKTYIKWDQLDEVDISMSRPSLLWKSSKTYIKEP